MSVKVKVFYDYVCPFCYLAHFPLEEAMKGKDLEVENCPFELRRAPTPKVDPMHDEMRLKRFDEEILPIVRELGVIMNLPRISPHPYTTLAFQGFHFAKEQGKEDAYNSLVFRTFYQDEKDIGELEVIKGVLTQLGLDAQAFEKIAAEGTYVKLLEEEKAYAKSQGVEHIPTVFIGNKRLEGFQKREVYEEAIAKALEEENGAHNVLEVYGGMACDLNGNCH